MDILWTSIQSVLEILLMIAIGYVGQQIGWFKDDFSPAISKLIMKVALPASIFMSMLERFKLKQLAQLWPGLVFCIVFVIVGFIIAFILGKLFRISRDRLGLFILGVNGANTVFIGMPLNQALFGDTATPYLLVFYIVNTITIWTVGVWIIAWFDQQQQANVKINWAHFLPAPLWGFIIALPILWIDPNFESQMPSFISTVLTDVGGLVTPLSLIYIGIMLARFGLNNIRFERDLNLALLGRFVISPIIMYVVVVLAAGMGLTVPALFSHTLIVQAATPALAVLPVLAGQYHQDVQYATNVVVATSVLFVVVVPVIMMLF